MELENTTSDVTDVFGSGSPEASLPSAVKATDLEGVAIHCSAADSVSGGLCANGETDALPDEPTGYTGFKGLFGAIQVNPVLTSGLRRGHRHPTAGVRRFRARRHQLHQGGSLEAATRGQPAGAVHAATGGFHRLARPAPRRSSTAPAIPASRASTGWRPTTRWATRPRPRRLVSRSPTPTSRTPTTTTYNQNGGDAFGPGEAGYEAQLRSTTPRSPPSSSRLANNGINKSNT